jgi:hypothetical protein
MKKLMLLMVVICTFLKQAVCSDLSQGLIGHWHLDADAQDSSGNGHHGTISGATTTTGKQSLAFHFDGSAFIDVGNLDFSSGSFSISGWVKTDRPAVQDDFRMWIGKLHPTTGGPFELFLGEGRVAAGGDGACFVVWDGGISTVNLSTQVRPNIRDGKWHMITLTYESGNQRLYSDGVLIDQGFYAGTLPQNSTGVRIGGMYFGPYHHPWIGDIDEVSIYGRSLSTVEVQALYNATVASLIISPDSNTFVDVQRFDIALILQNAKSPVKEAHLVFDGHELGYLPPALVKSGHIQNGSFSVLRNCSLPAGNHTFSVKLVLANGVVLTKEVRWKSLRHSSFPF